MNWGPGCCSAGLNAAAPAAFSMSSTYGWLTESALAIERPVPLRGVSQQSQLRLSSIVRKQRESQQAQVDAQRSLFVEAAKEGRVFTHDAPCSRRWTRPSKKASHMSRLLHLPPSPPLPSSSGKCFNAAVASALSAAFAGIQIA